MLNLEAYRDHDPHTEAIKRGRRLVLPDDYELFVDIDDSGSMLRFWHAYEMLSIAARGTGEPRWSYIVRPSPSGKPDRAHIVVRTGRRIADPLHRIALQAILGSDPIREALDWQRAMRGAPVVTCFFELPELPEPNISESGAAEQGVEQPKHDENDRDDADDTRNLSVDG